MNDREKNSDKRYWQSFTPTSSKSTPITITTISQLPTPTQLHSIIYISWTVWPSPCPASATLLSIWRSSPHPSTPACSAPGARGPGRPSPNTFRSNVSGATWWPNLELMEVVNNVWLYDVKVQNIETMQCFVEKGDNDTFAVLQFSCCFFLKDCWHLADCSAICLWYIWMMITTEI